MTNILSEEEAGGIKRLTLWPLQPPDRADLHIGHWTSGTQWYQICINAYKDWWHLLTYKTDEASTGPPSAMIGSLYILIL